MLWFDFQAWLRKTGTSLCSGLFGFDHILFICVYMCVGTKAPPRVRVCVEVRGQPARVSSLLQLCMLWGSNSGQQPRRQHLHLMSHPTSPLLWDRVWLCSPGWPWPHSPSYFVDYLKFVFFKPELARTFRIRKEMTLGEGGKLERLASVAMSRVAPGGWAVSWFHRWGTEATAGWLCISPVLQNSASLWHARSCL